MTKRLALLLMLLTLFGYGCRNNDKKVAPPDKKPVVAKKTVDPVCGKTVDPKTAMVVTESGQKFYFCCAQCKAEFMKNPHAKGQAFFDKGCSCPKGCKCQHCSGKFAPCPCGS